MTSVQLLNHSVHHQSPVSSVKMRNEFYRTRVLPIRSTLPASAAQGPYWFLEEGRQHAEPGPQRREQWLVGFRGQRADQREEPAESGILDCGL